MDADGGNPRRLTNNEAEDWWPTWSPDGSRIAFMSTLDGDWEIFVMDADGGNLQQLTDNVFDDRGPAWSPDGSRIAFATNRDSGIQHDTEIYIMNADGSDPVRVLEKVGFEWGVDWRWVDPISTTPLEELPAMGVTKELRLTIIYDNTTVDERLTPEWGFGVLLEYGGHRILFDTGGSNIFLENMLTLGIDPMSIDAVILSHEHLDHIGGLHGFLSAANRPVVYLLERFARNVKNAIRSRTDVVEVSGSMEIVPGVYTTGQVSGGGLYEQALAIDLGEEIVVITGCAHPGVVTMTRRGRSAVPPGIDGEPKPVLLVVGGFHLMGESRNRVEAIIEDLRELGVMRVSPTHCTGEEAIAIFAEILGDDYLLGGAGTVIQLP
jgi:7,8-dihydropterin-6-yl-methyl-4-(beta-D-ribofuranosyl)aminobenzene 5'-phosphate synthase